MCKLRTWNSNYNITEVNNHGSLVWTHPVAVPGLRVPLILLLTCTKQRVRQQLARLLLGDVVRPKRKSETSYIPPTSLSDWCRRCISVSSSGYADFLLHQFCVVYILFLQIRPLHLATALFTPEELADLISSSLILLFWLTMVRKSMSSTKCDHFTSIQWQLKLTFSASFWAIWSREPR